MTLAPRLLTAKVWLGRFLAVYVCVGVLVLRALDPVPQRFPDAMGAFLYENFTWTTAALIFAILGALVGFPFWAWHRRLVERTSEERGDSPRLARLRNATFFFFSMAWIGAIAFVPLLALEARSFSALTDAGVVSRSYWGAAHHQDWSALHHVELECRPPSRSWNPTTPIIRLRFDNGDTIGRVLGMNPYGTTLGEALGRLEEIRLREQAPLVWAKREQRDRFLRGEEALVDCIDNLLREFPVPSRTQIRRELNSPL